MLVGGGENLLRISQESVLTNAGLALKTKGDMSDADRERLYAAYMSKSQLDPAKGVSAMRDKPLRIYLATLDNVTPYACGEALAKRFGAAAEIDKYGFGHKQLLRWHMRERASDIVKWVDATLLKKSGE